MKKLLSATLAIAMGATCIWSLAACSSGDESDPEKDAASAKTAINSIKGLYDKADLYETTGSFTLLGKSGDGENLYDVTWTVSTESTAVNDITEYIKIGTQLDADYKYTVTVERPTEDIEYKLTASVTVGSVTETYTISRLLKGVSKVYTVAEFLAIDQDASHYIDVKSGNFTNKVYSEDGKTPAVFVVKGYVVSFANDGGWSSQFGNYNKVYIGDTPDASTTLYVYRIATDDVYIKADGDLKVGDLVTLQGTAHVYSGKLQMSYAGDISVTCLGKVREEKTDAQKVAEAKAAVKLSATYTAGEITLPSQQDDATLTWEVKSGSNVTISGSKMTVTNPDAETTVTVTVTIKSGSVTDTKDITFKVIPASTKGTATDPYTVAEAKTILNGLTKDSVYSVNGVEQEVYVHGYVTVAGEVNGTYGLKNVYIADTKGDTQANSVWIYNVNWGEAMPKDTELEVGDEITVKGYFKDYNGDKEIAQSTAKVYPVVTSLVKVQLTDEQKATKALAAIKDTLSDIATAGNVTLSTTTKVEGVTISWSTENTTYTVSENTLHVDALPTENDATVTLKVTATCGTASVDKNVTVVIKKAIVTPPSGDTIEDTLDFVTNYATITATGWSTSYANHEITFANAGASTLSGNVVLSNANKQDAGQSIDDRPVLCAKNALQYVTVTVTSDVTISEVEFGLSQWASKTFADIHIEYTTDGTTWTTCSDVITTPATLTSKNIPANVKSVRLSYIASKSQNTQMGLGSIKLTVK